MTAFRSPHRRALLLCALFVLLAAVYAAVTPPFEAPDEGAHFLYIHDLQQTGQLPVLEARDMVFASQSTQRHHPPLYYLAGAALTFWLEQGNAREHLLLNPLAAIGFAADNNLNVHLHEPTMSGGLLAAVWLLRGFSIALATGTLWLVYTAGRLAADSPRVGLFALLLAGCVPSFVHISASINNDNLVTFFYAAGVVWCLSLWQRAGRAPGLRWHDTALITLILAGAALSKLTGLTLFGVVYAVLLLGVFARRWSWRGALLSMGLALLGVGLLAGWWYLRNWQLYGDPLALAATARIWARGGPPQLIAWFELRGVWESFWFTLGHFNIRGPDWLYALYVPLLVLGGLAGALLAFWRRPLLRLRMLFLLGVCAVVIAALLVSSSRVNVSQGRILFPGMVAFIPLLALGWWMLCAEAGRVWHRWNDAARSAALLVVWLPLGVLALLTPSAYLAPAYPQARVLPVVPQNALRIDARAGDAAGGFDLLAYTLETPVVEQGQFMRLTLLFRGAHPARPLLFVRALDPLTGAVLGGVEAYPAMLPTDRLDPDTIYAVPLRLRLDQHTSSPNPQRLNLTFGWRVPSAAEITPGWRGGDNLPVPQQIFLPLADAQGTPLDALIVPGAVLCDCASLLASAPPPAPPLSNAVDVRYGDMIRLYGYTLSGTALHPGATLMVTLGWDALASPGEDWTLTLGLLDAQNTLIAQDDAMPAGFPTSAWFPGSVFSETRLLVIPADAPAGSYRLYLGWYRLSDLTRLQPVTVRAGGGAAQDGVWVLPEGITVAGAED